MRRGRKGHGVTHPHPGIASSRGLQGGFGMGRVKVPPHPSAIRGSRMLQGRVWGGRMLQGRVWGSRVLQGRVWGSRMLQGRVWGSRMLQGRVWGSACPAPPRREGGGGGGGAAPCRGGGGGDHPVPDPGPASDTPDPEQQPLAAPVPAPQIVLQHPAAPDPALQHPAGARQFDSGGEGSAWGRPSGAPLAAHGCGSPSAAPRGGALEPGLHSASAVIGRGGRPTPHSRTCTCGRGWGSAQPEVWAGSLLRGSHIGRRPRSFRRAAIRLGGRGG